MVRASLALAVLMAAGRITAASPQITSAEHWVEEKDGVKIYLWEKVAGNPQGKGIVVLAHGSATAGKESFDLQVQSRGSYSLRASLGGEGCDVFPLDTRGFGRSTHPE